MEKERMTKEEFKERLENLIREYDWDYEDECEFYSTDDKQHSLYELKIELKRYFRLK